MPDSLRSVLHAPYESTNDLRQENARLIEALDRRLGPDNRPDVETAALRDLETQIRDFLDRGCATGAFIEDIGQRTSCQVLLDYWASTLSHIGVPIERQRLATFDETRLPDLKDKPCPFMGLEPFRSGAFFFGRERAVDSLLKQIAENPLVIVHGASGSGKSSLVIAGALPVLKNERHAPAYRVVGPLAPGDSVLENLVGAVATATARAIQVDAEVGALRADPRRLPTLLGDKNGPPVLLVIDQFEEVFTLCQAPDKTAIAAALVALLDMRPDNRVILTVREEFSTELNKLEPLSGSLEKAHRARFSMQDFPMTSAELKAAIERPAALVNLQFAPGIVDEMVESVVALDAALPLLQFALCELWEQRDRNRITRDRYNTIGTPLTALTRFADDFYFHKAKQFEVQQEVKRILLELVTIGRMFEAYRQRLLRSRIIADGTPRTPEVLQLLANNGLVRITPIANGLDQTVEVTHEALLRNWPRYVEWIEEKKESMRRRVALTEAAERWQQAGRSATEGLLNEWQLHDAQQLPDLRPFERDYLQVSSDAIDRAKREHEHELLRRQKRRLLAGALGAAAVLLLVLAGGIAWYSNLLKKASNVDTDISRATENSYRGRHDHALVGALGAIDKLRSIKNLPFAGWFFWLHGGEHALTWQARDMLLAALHNASDLRRLFVGDAPVVHAVAFLPTTGPDALLAYGWADGKTYLTRLTESATIPPLNTCGNGLVTALAFDPSGRSLAAGCFDGTLSVWAVEGWHQLGVIKGLFRNRVWAVAFSTGGLIAAGSVGQRGRPDVALVTLGGDGVSPGLSPVPGWTKDSAQPVGGVWSLAFSPGGETLLVGDGVGAVHVCKMESQMWSCSPRREPLQSTPDDAAPSVSLDAADAIRALAYNAEGTQIAVGHWNGEVDVWNADFSRKESIARNQPGPVHSLTFFDACGGRYLAIGKARSLLYRSVDSPPGGAPQQADGCTVPLPASISDEIYGLAFHQASGLLATATLGGYIAVLDPSTRTDPPGRQQSRVPIPIHSWRGAIVAEEGSTAWLALPATTTSGPAKIALVTLRNGRRDDGDPVATRAVGDGHIRRVSSSVESSRVATLACASDSERVRCDDARVAVWQFDDFTRPIVLRSGNDFGKLTPRRIALSPDGQRLVVSFEGKGQLLMVPVAPGSADSTIESDLESVREIAFSDDGRSFAAAGPIKDSGTSSDMDRVQWWDVGDGGFKEGRSTLFQVPSVNRVSELGFVVDRRNDTLLLAGGQYGAIDVLNLRSGTWLLSSLRGDSRPISQIAFSRKASLLAATDSQNSVRLWDTSNWGTQNLQAAHGDVDLTISSDPVERAGFLAFSRDGTWLANGAAPPRFWTLDVDSLVREVCAILSDGGQQPAETGTQTWRSVCNERHQAGAR